MNARPKLLYVASRWPYPVQSGRARMIAQTMEMASGTFDVSVAAFAAPAAVAADRPAYLAHAVGLGRPAVAESAVNAIRSPLSPLQSHLFRSRKALADILALAALVNPDVIMVDMIRLAGYARALRQAFPRARLVLDMDDLLSDRYRQMRGEEGDILGAFASGMPKPVRKVAQGLPKALLSVETLLAGRAEMEAVRDMDAVVLVSGLEASRLRERSGAGGFIVDVPPAVVPTVARPRDFSSGMRVVLFGDETYAPNVQALIALDALAAGMSGRDFGRPVRFQAAGRLNGSVTTPNVERLGFVDDLDAFLGPDAVMVAPIVTGSGIKTKLLDAFVRGVPVITTPKGIEGIDLLPGRDVRLSSVAEMPDLLDGILSGRLDGELSEMGISAALRVSEAHAPARVMQNLLLALGESPAEPEAAEAA